MTHKWDYEYPDCFWEQMTWWVRWPFAVLLGLVFAALFAFPIIVHFSR